MLNCDILVVGAGPAGSSAAMEASKEGADVLLIEKNKFIGKPVRCAGYIPKLLLNEAGIHQESVAQEIHGMLTYLPNGDIIKTRSPGYILNRDIFDNYLAMIAEEAGVTVRTNTSCISKKDDMVLIQEKGKNMKIQPRIIIGADGPKSTVGRWIDSINKEFLLGMQYTVALTNKLNHTEIYFDRDFFGGYGWLFPKEKLANVGVGVKINSDKKNNRSIMNCLFRFIKFLNDENKIRDKVFSFTSGLIPVGGPLVTVKDNIMLVGDAAGHTHSITGGGIPQAVLCGRIAGGIAAKAVNNENLETLKEYENQWKNIFDAELKRAKIKRKYMEKYWNNLDLIIKKCWTACREYYYE